jgi:hypothetical protein
MDRDEIRALTDRLQRVERRVFVLGASWLLSVVLLMVLWIGTPHASSQTTALKARSLSIVDQNDRSRLFFGISDQGNSGVWLYDANGKTRVHLGVDFGKAPEIWFADENGNERLHFGIADADARAKFGTPTASIPQAWFFYDPSGPARLGFYAGGREGLALGANVRGDQGIWVFDAGGKVVWSAPHGLFGGVKP